MNDLSHYDKKIPIGKAFIILLTSMMFSGSLALGGYFFIQNIKNKRLNDARFNITAIAQNCTKGQPLKTGYFAEELNLSLDKPSNLDLFDLIEAKKKMLASPLIRAVGLKKRLPNILYIEYETREPIAFLADFTNTVVDIHGVSFPFKPFFTPKKLPKIYLGLSEFVESNVKPGYESGGWGKPLKGYRVELAFKIYKLLKHYFNTDAIEIIKIDTSKAFALSYGQREIVVVLEEHIPATSEKGSDIIAYPRMLRLSTGGYSQELSHYLALRNKWLNSSDNKAPATSKDTLKAPLMIIDLRLSNLAYIYQQSD